MPGDPARVYVHIGPPKTGTTYLQAIIWSNTVRLRSRGIHVPTGGDSRHFLAAQDLRGKDYQGHEHPARKGAWTRLAADVPRQPGAVSLISHEFFAGAPEDDIRRLVDDLSPAQVHVVYGARDIARQLPATWQELVKNRSRRTYERQLTRTMTNLRENRTDVEFWRGQHHTATLARWATHVPADRIHVVTVPQRGGRPEELWHRFCTAIGIDGSGFDLDVGRSNRSLSAEETEVLRLVNKAMPEDLPWPRYARQIKRRFNVRADAGSSGTPLTVPTDLRDELVAYTEDAKKELAGAGYDVIGSLDDLDPVDSSFGPRFDFSDPRVAQTAADMLAREYLRPRTAGRSVRRQVPRRLRRLVPTRIADRLRT